MSTPAKQFPLPGWLPLGVNDRGVGSAVNLALAVRVDFFRRAKGPLVAEVTYPVAHEGGAGELLTDRFADPGAVAALADAVGVDLAKLPCPPEPAGEAEF